MANLLGQNIGTNYKGILNLNTLNGNLTTTLEAITDGDGNASSLQLSTTQASIVANRNYNTLHIGGSVAVGMKITQSSDASTDGILFGFNGANGSYASIGNGSSLIMTTSAFSFHRTNYNSLIHANVFVGAGNLTPTISARLHVRGDGTNPVQRWENGAGTLLGRWLNNGNLIIGDDATANFATINIDGSGNLVISPNSGSGKTFRVATGVQNTFQIGGGWDSNGGFLFTGGTNNNASVNLNLYGFNGGNINFNSAGTASPRVFNISYIINNTAAQTGTATGIFLNATETALNGMGHNLMDLQVGGVSRFRVGRNGLGAFDNGVTGAFFSTNTHYYFSSRGALAASSDGVFRLVNNAETDFGRLQLGGTTNAFPAIKRNGAAIDFRLADDSGFCNVQANKMGLGGVSPAAAYDLTLNTSGLTMNPVASIDWGSGNARINCSTFDIFFSTYTGSSLTEKMRITSNGAMCMGTTTANASAIVQIDSTTRGVLLPRMTTTQINAIASPATGLVVYSTTENQLCLYNGTAWRKINDSPL